MKCIKCQKELPESEFYPSLIKRGWCICHKCYYKYNLKYAKKYNQSLKELPEKDFDRYYGGIKINITNYPQAYEIVKTSGEYFITKDKEEFIKKLLDILK